MPLLQIGKRKQAFPRMVDRIYFSVSSEGYGHSTRTLSLVRHFAEHEVLIGTYDYALERVKAFGHPCVEVHQEVKFIGDEGVFDIGKTIVQNQSLALGLGLKQIVNEESEILRNHGISLVVADGRMAPVLAAAQMGIPCIVLTNQSAFYPFFAQDSPLVKLFGRSFEWVMKFWLSSAEEIFIPDFPPPDTVCLPNLSNHFQVKKRTRFVGPLVTFDADQVAPIRRENADRPLVVLALGGHRYRRPLFDAVISMAAEMPDIEFQLLTPFTAENVSDNITRMGRVNDAAPFYKAADLVITQGGHSTAMELLSLGKPSIVVPDAHQIEQENNAGRMALLGVSLKLEYGHLAPLGASQTILKSAIRRVLEEPSFCDTAKEMGDKARLLNGSAKASQVLKEYAHRLLAY